MAYFVRTIQWNTYFEILSYKKAKFTLLHRNILSSHLIHSLLCHEHCFFVDNNTITTFIQHLMRALVQPRGRHAPPAEIGFTKKNSWPRRWAKYTKLCMVWQPNILNNCYELSGGCAPRTIHLGQLCPCVRLLSVGQRYITATAAYCRKLTNDIKLPSISLFNGTPTTP